jgi:cysteine-rich repeat protein
MNSTRTLYLVMSLVLAVSGCISLPDVDPAEQLPPDAGIPDAGQPDAGLPDAGLPDAGPPDGGNTLCGDGKIDSDQGEVCDDRNTAAGDGCSADCLSNETCGNGVRDSSNNEACDDGNTTTEVACPYGTPVCTRCNSTCTQELTLAGYYCGDGIGNAPNEVCDDGNSVTETECAYGTSSCVQCDANCARQMNLTGPYCGDNIQNGPESCDDGNTVTETACPYGTPTCSACDSACARRLNLVGPYCGDGSRNGSEVCDDGNASVCGSCSADCAQPQLSRAAGKIFVVPPGDLRDAETFTLDDGINPARVFEFDKNGQSTTAHIRVDIATFTSGEEVAAALAAIINDIGNSLRITAEPSSDEVWLSNDLEGTFGNKSISENVANIFFRVNGMSGGAGRDCSRGTGCAQDADCQPNLVCKPTRVCDLP